MKSIKFQITSGVIIILFISLLVAMAISYTKALHEIEEIFDAELSQTAKMISRLTDLRIDSSHRPIAEKYKNNLPEKISKYEKQISYQIWYKDTLVLKSSSAPNTPLGTQSGYQNIILKKELWRVFGLHTTNSPYKIYAAESIEGRKELSWFFATESLGVFLWALPILILLILMIVNQSLSPLIRISSQISKLDIGKLHSLKINNIPKEISPLINALNRLLNRLDLAINRERQFSADASHELRTPLSTIRLYTQLAQRASTENEKNTSLEKVIRAVDQSKHLVEQLLTLSKLDQTNIQIKFEPILLRDLCQSLHEDLSILAKKNSILLNFTIETKKETVITNQHLLYTVLRNLIDNAIRYSATNTQVECLIKEKNETIIFQIIDSGPGIPNEQLEQVNQRFYRLAGQETDGCGLGLAIVYQAIKHLNSHLELKNRYDANTGLIATLTLNLKL